MTPHTHHGRRDGWRDQHACWCPFPTKSDSHRIGVTPLRAASTEVAARTSARPRCRVWMPSLAHAGLFRRR